MTLSLFRMQDRIQMDLRIKPSLAATAQKKNHCSLLKDFLCQSSRKKTLLLISSWYRRLMDLCGQVSVTTRLISHLTFGIVLCFAWQSGNTLTEISRTEKAKRVATGLIKFIVLLGCLYFLLCSLDLLGSAFRLLAGKSAGQIFQSSELLNNPVAGSNGWNIGYGSSSKFQHLHSHNCDYGWQQK